MKPLFTRKRGGPNWTVTGLTMVLVASVISNISGSAFAENSIPLVDRAPRGGLLKLSAHSLVRLRETPAASANGASVCHWQSDESSSKLGLMHLGKLNPPSPAAENKAGNCNRALLESSGVYRSTSAAGDASMYLYTGDYVCAATGARVYTASCATPAGDGKRDPRLFAPGARPNDCPLAHECATSGTANTQVAIELISPRLEVEPAVAARPAASEARGAL